MSRVRTGWLYLATANRIRRNARGTKILFFVCPRCNKETRNSLGIRPEENKINEGHTPIALDFPSEMDALGAGAARIQNWYIEGNNFGRPWKQLRWLLWYYSGLIKECVCPYWSMFFFLLHSRKSARSGRRRKEYPGKIWDDCCIW